MLNYNNIAPELNQNNGACLFRERQVKIKECQIIKLFSLDNMAIDRT